jgi:hypothetical protein
MTKLSRQELADLDADIPGGRDATEVASVLLTGSLAFEGY